MELALAAGCIKPLKRVDMHNVSHILFADEMLVFCQGHKESAQGVDNLLVKLKLYTWLAINKLKSKVFLSKGCKHKTEIVGILGVSLGSFPIKYSNLPLSSSYPKARHFFSTDRQGESKNR